MASMRATRAETRAARSETPRNVKKVESVEDDATPATRAEDDDEEEVGVRDKEERNARGRRTGDGDDDAAMTADVEELDVAVGEAASGRVQNGNSGGDASLSCNPDDVDAVELEKTKKRKKTSPTITSEGETLPSDALCNSDAGEVGGEEEAGGQKRRRINEKAGSPGDSSPENNGAPADTSGGKCWPSEP